MRTYTISEGVLIKELCRMKKKRASIMGELAKNHSRKALSIAIKRMEQRMLRNKKENNDD